MEDNVRKRMYMCMCDWVTWPYSDSTPKTNYNGKNKNHLKKKKNTEVHPAAIEENSNRHDD